MTENTIIYLIWELRGLQQMFKHDPKSNHFGRLENLELVHNLVISFYTGFQAQIKPCETHKQSMQRPMSYFTQKFIYILTFRLAISANVAYCLLSVKKKEQINCF